REIRDCHAALEPLAREAGFITCDLHGDLDLKQQDQAVSDSATRKVVLSTNVAESSVTVPGTTGVIDSGLARVARHSPWTGLLSLKLEKISQASATQRAGRAGRTAPGLVQRLYTAGDLSTRPSFDTPEILRADLASLLLELGCAELSVSELGWLSAPPEAALRDAERLLSWLGALKSDRATDLGRRMQRLPLPPRLARALIRAEELEVPASGALAVALLSERDILARSPVGHSRGPRTVDASGDSDIAERMERFQLCREDRFSHHSARSLELNLTAVKSVARAEAQLRKALAGKGEVHDDCPLAEVDARISQALLSGFPDRVAARRLSTAGKGVSRDLTFMSGQVARLSEQSVVHEAQLLLALDVADRRGAAGPEVTQACVIEEDWLFEAYPDLFTDKDELWFNPDTARVERIARIYYGSVCIDERKAPAAPGPEATQVLKEWVLTRGLKQLDPKDHLGELAARIELCLEADASLSGSSPRGDCRAVTPRRAVTPLRAVTLRQRLLPNPRELAGALPRGSGRPERVQVSGGGRRRPEPVARRARRRPLPGCASGDHAEGRPQGAGSLHGWQRALGAVLLAGLLRQHPDSVHRRGTRPPHLAPAGTESSRHPGHPGFGGLLAARLPRAPAPAQPSLSPPRVARRRRQRDATCPAATETARKEVANGLRASS
ncbi:MAG: helicase-related protein, partial [Polyangiaceae bacterium]